jgi:hypothetical protein
VTFDRGAFWARQWEYLSRYLPQRAAADALETSPEARNNLYNFGIHPDAVMARLERYVCIRGISFAWDQWAGCRIECMHGDYRGVSAGMFNPLGQSLYSAFRQFEKANHDLCVNDDHICFGEGPDHPDQGVDRCPTDGLVVDAERCPFDGKLVYANQ